MMDTKVTGADRAGVIAPPPLIFAFFFAVGYGLQLIFPSNELMPDIMRPFGIALAVVAALIAISGFVTMKSAGTHVDPSKATIKIVTSGPFSYSRNPLYLASVLLYIGTALFAPVLWSLATLPFVLVVIQKGVIAREEKYLEEKFGDEYIRYKKSTPRWLI